MVTREDLHRLVDDLPESDMEIAHRLLQTLHAGSELDGFLIALLTAPDDDEPPTPEEDNAVAKAWQQYLRGDVRDWSHVRDELAGE